MGSQSDWPTMREAAAILDELGVAYEARIVSAHRTPDRLWDYGKTAVDRGPQGDHRGRGRGGASARHDGVEDAGAGDRRAGADQGAVGLDSLYSIVQMPRGYPSRPWPSARRGRPMPGSWPPRSSR
jgi:5-(carboxyamino)imidazole ribonucleotide mutase